MFFPERFRSTRRKAMALALLLGVSLAIGATLPASAMDAAAADDHRGDKQERGRDERHDNRRDARPAPRAEATRQGSSFQGGNPGGGFRGGAPAGAGNNPGANFQGGGFRGGAPSGAGNANNQFNRNGPPVVGQPRGTTGPDARFVAPSRAYGFNRPPPPERIVQRLPPGYRSYNWGDSQYYHHEGHWYRPYGGSYVIVGAPYGLFVPYLPGVYSTFWFGGTRYFMADDTYYLYEPQRQGYVVTQSPYGDNEDEIDDSGRRDSDLFVYPTRGQSEQQQADDRYECHRWAVNEAHYDPTDAEFRSADRQAYDRALTACLTGRGYSVK
jgi:hypothetical protein